MFNFRAYAACAAATVFFLHFPKAEAASSTSRGEISITQVQSMLNQAAVNSTARQALTAYLAGVGETAGVLIDLARSHPPAGRLVCKGALALDDNRVRIALERETTRNPAETPATPLIVRDMLKRAECDIR